MTDAVTQPPPRDWSAGALWALIAAVTLAKVPIAAAMPLSGDEAYYWDCSRHLDWCYFDQPGLVIWTMIPFRALLGETALAVRAPALLFGALAGVFVVRIVLRLGGTRRRAAAAWGLLQATPLFLIGSMYASTDVAMMAAYAAATLAAMAIGSGERRGWWGFAVAVGLGFNGKFTIVLVLAALLPALLRRAVLAQLRTATPWLAALLCVALTAPVWIWGALHDWDNIRFQLARVPEGFHPLRLAEFWGATLLLVTPTLGVAAAIGWVVSLGRHRDTAWWVWRVAAATPLLFWSVLATRGQVGGHWSAPGSVLAIVALALLPFRGRRPLVVAGVATCAVAVPLLLSVPLFPGAWTAAERQLRTLQGRPEKLELHKVFGYRDLVAEVRRRLRPGELAATHRYSYAHLIGFLTEGELPVLLFRGTNHGLASLYWHDPDALRGRDVLVFLTAPELVDELRPLFASVTEVEPFEIRDGDQVVQRWQFFRCHDLREPYPAFTRLHD